MAHTQNLLKSNPRQFCCRRRRCLLKGCERRFCPKAPSARYCSKECREKARRWRVARARERYRRTENGKAMRRNQARKRRRRLKERTRGESGAAGTSVGDHSECNEGVICARPGCYERVIPTDRSPLKKYCSRDCYAAMRCVLERERRRRERIRERQRRVEDIEKRSPSRIGHSERREL